MGREEIQLRHAGHSIMEVRLLYARWWNIIAFFYQLTPNEAVGLS